MVSSCAFSNTTSESNRGLAGGTVLARRISTSGRCSLPRSDTQDARTVRSHSATESAGSTATRTGIVARNMPTIESASGIVPRRVVFDAPNMTSLRPLSCATRTAHAPRRMLLSDRPSRAASERSRSVASRERCTSGSRSAVTSECGGSTGELRIRLGVENPARRLCQKARAAAWSWPEIHSMYSRYGRSVTAWPVRPAYEAKTSLRMTSKARPSIRM